MKSSASDNSSYTELCSIAAKDNVVFSTFRKHRAYHDILEHFSYENGLKYLNEIKTENPGLLNNIDVFRTNDLYGGADIHSYPEIGDISPSTLHYIRQLSYVQDFFGDLGGKNIVEIGGGYGGLAKLIMDQFNIASYTIFDLKPVLDLTKKYLGSFTDKYLGKLQLETLENYHENREYDILISNCAFTECVPAIQDEYLNKVIKFSKSGFIIYNKRHESYHPVILLSKLENCGLKNIGSQQMTPPNPSVFITAWNTSKKLNKLPYKRRIFYKNSPKLYCLLLKLYQRLK